ncbi:hypothetical protein A2797_01260 [candidate division WWE3 bacterium RIFCSPHIGHO2_01_FULL_48_15]|uniref:Glycoside hydrolase family 42 N-terminal domain-containing protein n=1 Tax=candidate division WWE3 bacterium RIFCSPHIGHO2_01_FULL_48_15 TaxID=1802619 RepID=A0A1F4VFS7_UNCKA|nr:MAG: hypothetical protein A2797_01260 [candidate division WWE3 bacterium RIFCSPHIGHO2_01_FULL_48_15]
MKKLFLKVLKIVGISFGAVVGVLVLLIAAAYFLFDRRQEAYPITWGVSFDPYYTQRLGLDWKKTYLALLDDLKVDHLRLVAFWDKVEPKKDQFDFTDLDFQVQEAEKRGVKLVIAAGRRLPRWPECYVPEWAQGLSENKQQEEILDFLPQVVNRYKNSPALEVWQVENESFVIFFTGNCPPLEESFLDKEISLVGELDPFHRVMITESGEGSIWFKASGKTDILGVSLYRVIYVNKPPWEGYYDYFLPVELFQVKANFWRALGRIKEIWVTELQGEPFLPDPITPGTSLADFYRSMSPEQFQKNLKFARATGFDHFYLWGAEWWVYMKEKMDVPFFYEEAKKLWQ